MKRIIRTIQVVLLFFLLMAGKNSLLAASGSISFSTTDAQPQVGDTFTVVCTVSSQTAFTDVDFYVYYDSSILKFVNGGSKVTGSDGTLRLKSVENTSSAYKRTFSLEFKGKKAGGSMISLGEPAKVVDGENAQLSLSSNRLSVSVLKKGQKAGDSTPTSKEDEGDSTNTVQGPTDATLAYLTTSGVDLSPKFSGKTTKYTVTVANTDSTLFFDYRTSDANASVSIEGNTDLQVGENEVTLTVRPPSGSSKRYVFLVNRETEEETSLREIKNGKTPISVRVTKKDGKIIIENQYQFQVLDVMDASTMPAGYICTKVSIAGVEVPAYTMQTDLESNYLLLYLQGPTGKPEVYQYDRQEQTLQRYTGEMTNRVNQKGTLPGSQTSGDSSSKLTTMFIVIVIMIMIILMLLAFIIKLVLKNRKNKKDFHELDF